MVSLQLGVDPPWFMLLDGLAQRVKDEGLEVICVPSSFQAKQLIIQYGLKLGYLEMNPEVF
jgi:ribose 5-phosphate isomerase A